jgi:hypothetical protein
MGRIIGAAAVVAQLRNILLAQMHIEIGFWDVPQFLHEPLSYNSGDRQKQLFQESALTIWVTRDWHA